MTQAQATAAIHAHLTDTEDRDKLQQSLEELTQASYGGYTADRLDGILTPRLVLPRTLPHFTNGIRSLAHFPSCLPTTCTSSRARTSTA